MKYNTKQPQRLDDRVVVYCGNCVSCGRKTYGYIDETNPDPRGAIDPYHCAHDLVAEEYDMTGDDVPMCFDCHNTQVTYKKGLEIAKRLYWHEKAI